jgi:hypothetical protein
MAALIRYGMDNNLGPSLAAEQPLPDQPESSM